jgi:hypothetical protein
MKSRLLSSFLFIALLTLVFSCQQNKDEGQGTEQASEAAGGEANKEGGEDNAEGGDETQINTKEETPTKMIEYLVGEWQVERIMDGEKNVTDAQGGSGQRIIFTNEARYIKRSGNQKIDSGAFRMNEQLENLYLESETNAQPQEYEVTLKSGTMTLTAKEKQNGKSNLKYFYRKSQSTSQNN